MNVTMYRDDILNICLEFVRELSGDPDVDTSMIYLHESNDGLQVSIPSLDVSDLDDLCDEIYDGISDPMLHVETEYTESSDYVITIKDATDSVESTTDVLGYDEHLDPPDDNTNVINVDDFIASTSFHLEIEVDVKEGYYPEIRNLEHFEAQAEFDLYDSETGFSYELSDPSDVMEDVMSLLERYEYPSEEGTYRMSGDFTLAYEISGLDRIPGEEFDDADSYFDDNITVRFDSSSSSIQNLEFAISDKRAIETSTSVEYNDNIKKEFSHVYDTLQSARYENVLYHIRYVEVDSEQSSSDEMFNQFKAQITEIHPYDDAKYIWVRIESGKIKFIQDGKVIQTEYYSSPDDMDVENYEWCTIICDDAIRLMRDMNQSVVPKMVHN